MSSKLFAILLVLSVLACNIQAQESSYPKEQKCGKNEVWTNCGTACPLRCNQPPPEACILLCIFGCQCKPGYLLNDKNECVPTLSRFIREKKID